MNFMNYLLFDCFYIGCIYIFYKIKEWYMVDDEWMLVSMLNPAESDRVIYAYNYNSFINIPLTKRYFYYLLVCLCELYLSVFFWTDVLFWFLVLPFITEYVCNYDTFNKFYLKIYDEFSNIILDIVINNTKEFLGFCIKVSTTIEYKIESYELLKLYNQLKLKKFSTILKLIISGVIHDYVYYYYSILLFKKHSETKVNRYKKEIVSIIKSGDINNLLKIHNIRKLMVIYKHTYPKSLYERITAKIKKQFIIINSYWGILSFINIIIPNRIYSTLLFCTLINIIEEIKNAWILSGMIYFNNYDFLSIIYLLYLKSNFNKVIVLLIKEHKLKLNIWIILWVLGCGILTWFNIQHLLYNFLLCFTTYNIYSIIINSPDVNLRESYFL